MEASLGISQTLRAETRLQSASRFRQDRVEKLLSRGLPYSRKLSSHSSCVNCVTFSGDGRWLASAGDDPYIFLWDFHQDDLIGPSHSFRGPRENVFALAFSNSGRHLYSGDTDNMIYKYDLSRAPTFSASPERYADSYMTHTDSIRAISCHPELEDVFLSASEDGRVVLHDGRAESRMSKAQATLQQTADFSGVQYHPTIPHFFLTSDKTGVCLRDVRMAFGPRRLRSNEGVVQKFVTSISKPSVPHLCQPEIGSVTFDRTGSRLAVTLLGYYPTIYSISDPYPLAICSGRYQPDGNDIPTGERTYANSCTIKHGSFGGPGLDKDDYYSTGSDDFRAYVWKLPSDSLLREHQQVIDYEQWGALVEDPVGFAATAASDRYIPMELSRPHCRLAGHKSIVNSTLWHPHWPYLVTAGVERHILLHSPTSDTPCIADMPLTPQEVRELPGPNPEDRGRMIRALTQGRDLDDPDVDRNDINTIALFDEILRSEGSLDIFASNRWSPDSDDDFVMDET
ncbi:WD40 domain-containing protein [Phanerochaete sordida]|uniref:WD40 domain-containing protein n=1 Tax=Phanerochaete sordida TaxID=48140 RepID=A0A9P3LBD5_9APHY|nr:WD40 domain-containing protein [Phanerochaete sordida]